MDKIVFSWIVSLPPQMQTIVIIIVLFLGYKGILKIPFIKKKEIKTHDGCPLFGDHERLIQEAVKRAETETKKIYKNVIDQIIKEHKLDKEVFSLRAKNSELIKEYKTHDILLEQMSVVSIKQARVMSLMLNAHADINSTPSENKNYANLLLKPKSEIKTMIRQWLRLNGYAEKTVAEFELYKEEHINLIISYVTEYLNNNYVGFSSSRSNLKVKNLTEAVPEIKAIYNRMFDECRNISIKYQKKINELEEEVKLLEDIQKKELRK